MTRRLSFPALSFCGPALLAMALGAQQPVTLQAGNGGLQRGPQAPRNLKVLPQNTDLRAVMHEYTADLGVNCEFCHTAVDPVTHRGDRASDANPTKEVARYMIQMTDDLNGKYLAQIKDRHDTNPITCGTCHRGEKHPSVFVAPPQAEGNRPPGMPPGGPPTH
jgi:hypothetical protein